MGYVTKIALFSQSLFRTIVILICFIASDAFADSGIQPSVDVAQFFDPEGNSYMEIYYAIQESGVHYVEDAQGRLSCQLVMDVEIRHEGTLWANKVWKIEKSVQDTSEVKKGSQLVDLLRYFIEKPGEYAIKMHVKDMHEPTSIDSAATVLTAKSFDSDGIEMSDVQLASHIGKAEKNAARALVKNSYRIMPSPNAVYGLGAPNLYYYFEAYNLQDQVRGDTYKTVCKVIDSQGNEIEGLGITYRTKKKMSDTSIEIGMLNVVGLPSGKYSFVYGIAEDDKSLLASNEKMFYVYNPGVTLPEKDRVSAVASGNYGPLEALTEEELDDEFARLIYVNTKDDREFYNNLETADGKREYILSIWSRNNEENLPSVVYRTQYLGRAQYADQHFKSVYGAGWKSDRGRVVILYGSPSSVERFPSSESTVPYQIWRYDKLRGQGGVEFVFADQEGFNKYELVHSDLRGERNDPDWKSQVFRGSNERQFR